MQSICQRIREGGEQYPGVRIGTRQKDGAMESNNGLARASGARDARRAVISPFNPLPLFGMQKDHPLFPRKFERPHQLFDVAHHAEAALGIGMLKGIGGGGDRLWNARFTTGGQFQQRLGGLSRQIIGQGEQGVFGRLPDIEQPFDRHAIAQQRFIIGFGKEGRLGFGDIGGNQDFLNRFADLHQLGGASFGMGFQFAPLGPRIGRIMVINVTEQQATFGLVDDQAQITADAYRPEVFVARPVEFVKTHARVDRIEL